MSEHKIIVVGMGFSGAYAAYLLKKTGYDVIVLHKGFGATAFSSGCFDILGYSIEKGEYLEDFKEGIDEVLSKENHPYAIVTDASRTKFEKMLNDAWRNLPEDLKAIYINNRNKNWFVITQLGTIKPTAAIQASMKGAMISEENVSICITGFKGDPGFNPSFVAKLLRSYIQALSFPNIEVTHAIIDIGVRGVEELSYYINIRNNLHDLYKKFKQLARRNRIDIFLIPALLDLETFSLLKDLNEESDFLISEMPSGPRYYAGFRLQRLLSRVLDDTGVRYSRVKELQVTLEGERAKEVLWRDAISDKTFRTQDFEAIVIATGDIIGGGLAILADESLNKYLQDTVFNYRIRNLGLEGGFADSYIWGDHEVLRSGLIINESSQVIMGENVLENVFACGSVLGGYDYTRELNGLGVALITAYNVVENIRRLVS